MRTIVALIVLGLTACQPGSPDDLAPTGSSALAASQPRDDDDGDGDPNDTDCAPDDPLIYTGATEACDDVDSDCDDDLVDEFDDTDGDDEPDCIDEDDDGDGDPDLSDCAPLNENVHAGAMEACDAVDSDCDGDLVDGFVDTDSDGTPDCVDGDADGDGWGAALDCDETDDEVHPGAVEVCDATDSDCDGDLVDGFADTDGDGLPDCVEDDADGDGVIDASDCAPLDPDIFPGNVEVPDDGVDQDCTGADTISCHLDLDGDGFGDPAIVLGEGDCGDLLTDGTDCDDDDDLTYPGADELCDELDNDCDGDVDEELETVDWYADADGDGFGDPDLPWLHNPDCDPPLGHATNDTDCDDDDPAVHPDAEEVCDGVDTDCDGVTDDDELDLDGDGLAPCDGDCDDDDPSVYFGAEEVCDDDVDQDCDGGEDPDQDRDDAECWPGGCEDCSAAGHSHPGLLLLLPALVLLRRRRRQTVAPSRRVALAPLALLAVGLLAPRGAHAFEVEQAIRQLDFARQELARGELTRALRSSESALRLCPTCQDGVVVKALAYEALGNLRIAEALLLAYVEAVGEANAGAEADGALARVQASLEGRHREGPVRTTPFGVDEVEVSPVAGLDPDPYRVRIDKALGKGLCLAARAASAELLLADPDAADGWKLMGDAARCQGEIRDAVVAYRRFEDAGGQNRPVREMLQTLEMNLCTVVARVHTAGGGPAPTVRLDTGSEYLLPAPLGPVQAFTDLPANLEMRLVISGRGLRTEERTVPPVFPGDTVEVAVTPARVGTGEVRIAEAATPGLTVSLISGEEVSTPGPGEAVEVTAGALVARVRSDDGELDVPLEVPRDGELVFEPSAHRPTSLTVTGLPAGASVRLVVRTVAGEVTERLATLRADHGDIDPSSGVRVAPPTRFDSLPSGSGGLFVKHPTLGAGTTPVVLEDAGGLSMAWPLDTLEGVPRVREAWLAWSRQSRRARSGRTTAGAGAAISAILAGAGAALLVGAAAQNDVLARSKATGIAATTSAYDDAAFEEAWEQNQTAGAARTGLLVGGGVSLGLGAVGFTVTLGASRSGRQAATTLTPWDPDAVE